MGSKEIGLFVIFFTHFQFLASSSSQLLHKGSDSLQEHKLGLTGRHEHDIGGVKGDGSERNSLVHSSKFAHGGVSGGRSTGGAAADSGGSTGATESGNGSGNGNGKGGVAVIPVIVAGAANNRHPRKHNGAARSNTNAMGLPTMIMITSATLIVHLSVRVQ